MHVQHMCTQIQDAGKSLARQGRKEANVSVRMAFVSAPYLAGRESG